MSSPSRRKVVLTPRFLTDYEKHLAGISRAEEALTGFKEVVARQPENGMTAPGGPPDALVRPIHPPGRAFAIAYTYDERRVYLLALRPVPSDRF